MLNLITSLILVSLLIPSGFNFLTQKVIDYSYQEVSQELEAPVRIINKSFGLKTTAKSIMIVDDASGLVLYDKNSKEILPIASLTKLMTALVFLETDPDWEEVIEIIAADQIEGAKVYLLTGEKVTIRDLFNLTLVASVNEAAVALARVAGIEDFPAAMNKKAQELEMVDTYFLDPSGIEVENVSTPADLIKLAQAAFSQEEIVKALATKEYEFTVLNNQRQGKATNNNKLLDSFLNYSGYQIIGAKTGYLNEAGYCLLLAIKKVEGPSLTLILLGTETITDRWQEAKGLIDWVFRNYQWPDSQ
jgi:D-alanyl-D-alanine carboxypeptidase